MGDSMPVRIHSSQIEQLKITNPTPLNQIGEFVYYRTYSRFLEWEGRREEWIETCKRAVEYNVSLAYKHLKEIGFEPDIDALRNEALDLLVAMYNTEQFLSGRTMWVGGAENGVADKYPLANFNCSFTDIDVLRDMSELFYMLLVGTGVGFRCFPEQARKLELIRTDVKVIHSDYNPLPKNERIEHTAINDLGNGYLKVYVGDSKEGWVEAVNWYFTILTFHEFAHVHTIKFNYNSIRPKGERLRTFGGTASGPEPLREMFDGFDKVLKNEIDPFLDPLEFAIEKNGASYYHLRPIHILDMGNLIGNNVVVGGVRRTAEIFLMAATDWECIFAKYGINGIWNEEQHEKIIGLLYDLGQAKWADKLRSLKAMDANARPLHHRRMSNNSIAFETKPSREMLNLVFEIMKAEGEPGFINLEEAQRRAPGRRGLNPCAEILLGSKGVCNLTTVVFSAFVVETVNGYELRLNDLIEAQKRSARAGVRMTLVDLELPEWDRIQKRDRLTGTSLTGWKDGIEKLGYNENEEEQLLKLLSKVARDESDRYARELRVPAPLLVTTVKPEGTLSQVAGGVSSGLHYSHSEYFIRRIRINAADPLAKVVLDLGWSVNPEVGTPGTTYDERMKNARTYVIDFPIYSGSTKTKDDISVVDQFKTYFRFQRAYTEHNSSNTITVKPTEWLEAEQIVWDNWDDFTAVSFLAHDGGSYDLAPYESITAEEYETLKASMKPFDPSLLLKYEKVEFEFDIGNDGCENGICPIR